MNTIKNGKRKKKSKDFFPVIVTWINFFFNTKILKNYSIIFYVK